MVNEVGKEITSHRHQLFLCIVQLPMYFISLHQPHGSGQLIWLISEPRCFNRQKNMELRARFFASDHCIIFLSTLAISSAHRAPTDGRTENP